MMFDCPSHMITTWWETQTVLVVLPIGALWAGWKNRKGTERKKDQKGVGQNNSLWLLVMHVRNEKARNLKALT